MKVPLPWLLLPAAIELAHRAARPPRRSVRAGGGLELFACMSAGDGLAARALPCSRNRCHNRSCEMSPVVWSGGLVCHSIADVNVYHGHGNCFLPALLAEGEAGG
jgi:hypothetical protein